MFTTDPRHRKEYIDGLRQLADYLETHPGTPVPSYGTTILVSVPNVEDGGREEVEHASCCLGEPIATTENGTVETYRIFGPITYKVYALTKATLRRHHAESSYRGCVSPDD